MRSEVDLPEDVTVWLCVQVVCFDDESAILCCAAAEKRLVDGIWHKFDDVIERGHEFDARRSDSI